jgi:hypothetical protein
MAAWGLPSALAHSTLWTSRLDYRIVQSPVLLGVEYRMLRQLELADNRSGWLNELSLDANPHVRPRRRLQLQPLLGRPAGAHAGDREGLVPPRAEPLLILSR